MLTNEQARQELKYLLTDVQQARQFNDKDEMLEFGKAMKILTGEDDPSAWLWTEECEDLIVSMAEKVHSPEGPNASELMNYMIMFNRRGGYQTDLPSALKIMRLKRQPDYVETPTDVLIASVNSVV